MFFKPSFQARLFVVRLAICFLTILSTTLPRFDKTSHARLGDGGGRHFGRQSIESGSPNDNLAHGHTRH
jgi:hypothetical protein